MSILARFSHTSGVDLKAHHVPRHIISFVKQNREHLRRAAEDRYGSVLVSHPPRTRHSIIAFRSTMRPLFKQWLDHNSLFLATCSCKPRNHRVSFHSVGPLVPSSMARSITESSIPSMGAQIIGSNPNGRVSNQGGAMSVSVNPPAMKGVTFGSFPTQFAGAMQIWCPNQEEIIPAKRWVFKLWLV